MRSDIVPEAIFPNYELSDHTAAKTTGTFYVSGRA